jgi:hypothetical protein
MARVFICRAHSKREPGYSIPGEESLSEWYLSEEFCRGAAAAFNDSDHMVEILGSTLGIRIACIRDHCRKLPDVPTVAVEMHCNQMPGVAKQRGYFCMAWYSSAAALEMSREINQEIRTLRPSAKCRGINKVSHTHRWVGTELEYPDDQLGFLEDIPCPSVIVETGYLSNPIDAGWLRERENRFSLGLAVGKGIRNFLEV